MTDWSPKGLELDAGEMERLVRLAMDRIVPHVESLPEQPASYELGAEALARSLVEPLPQRGESLESILDLVFERLCPQSFNAAGPGYLAYVPAGGLFAAAVADLIAKAVNRYTGVWLAAPGLVQLEANVGRWFCDIVGYPAESLGILTSGGSMAHFTAIVTARRARLPENFLSGVIYTSDQGHHTIEKAALLAGFPPSSLRTIPSDERFCLRCDLLRQAIARDRGEGLTPFLIVASAGTTNTGAVDDLEELSRIAGEEDLWLHLDAAYGGFFMLTERGRRVMRGIERADSMILDPHKSLFQPYGTGSLLVRDGVTLRRAHSSQADYMPAFQESLERLDLCEVSPELSRDYRGLRVWLPLKLHGIAPFRQALDEKLDLTLWATEELRKIEGIEIVAEPQLSTVVFRLGRPGSDNEGTNRLNRRLLDSINARQRVYLTPTVLGERFVIRICVLSFRTHKDRMEVALRDIRDAVAEVGRGPGC